MKASNSTPAPTLPLPFIYLTVCLCGAAVMIVEILGAKLLAPYVGTSHFVWTAQIAVTLLALSIGYQVGGWLADRAKSPNPLYAAIGLAAVHLAIDAVVVEKVAYTFLGMSLPAATLIMAMVLFFLPLFLLAMTGPFLTRAVTRSVESVGSNAGRVAAISTGGSFAGTVLVGYVLIPLFPNSRILAFTALLLALLCGIYAMLRKKQAGGVAVIALMGLLLAGAATASPAFPTVAGTKILFEGNSNFGQLQVAEMNANRRLYLNDYLVQNTFDPVRKESVSMFTWSLEAFARSYTPELRSALCIGMGVGIVPMRLARSGVKVDVVEINPAVVPVAQRFFDFDPTKLRLNIGDGRQFLNANREKYDAIVLDAFLGDSSPSHLMTIEAFRAMRDHLNPDGVLVINSFCSFDQGRDFFAASLHGTLKAAFTKVEIHAAGNGNVFFLATPAKELILRHEPDYAAMNQNVAFQVKQAFASSLETDPAHQRVLTDDYNPVDVYDAKNRESLRRTLAWSMHEQ